MKAVAKRDITEYEQSLGIKFTSNQKYDYGQDKENFIIWLIDDNKIKIEFCGEPKDLEDKFNFVEEMEDDE